MAAIKESKWNLEAHAALCGALADALTAAGSRPSDHKDSIMAVMATKGHEFTWEAIRITGSRLLSDIASFSKYGLQMPKWDETARSDLLIALYTATQPLLSKEVHDQVVDIMKAKGHEDANWDLIRTIAAQTSANSITKMPVKYEDIKADLMEALYIVAQPDFSKEQKEAVEAIMSERGHDLKWNAISVRYLNAFSPLVVRTTSLLLQPHDFVIHAISRPPIPQSITAFTMPTWEEIRDDLFLAHLIVQPALNKEQQDEVENIMQARGHNMVWNAIRGTRAVTTRCRLTLFPHVSLQHHTTLQSPTMSTKRVQQKWDNEIHEAILVEMVDRLRPTKSDWDAIIENLRGKGFTFTASALFTSSNMPKPTAWDHDAHVQLLQAIILEAPPTPVEWDGIIARVEAKGYSYTASAALYGFFCIYSSFRILSLSLLSPLPLPLPLLLLHFYSIHLNYLSRHISYQTLRRLSSVNPSLSPTSHSHSSQPRHPSKNFFGKMSDRMTWDHHADHDLLTAITQELQPSQEQLRAVMARMHSYGYSCTVKAITQHLQKLRRKEGTGPATNSGGNGSDGGNGTASPAPKTPRGGKKRAPPSASKTPGSATGKRKGKAAAELSSAVALDDDDEEVDFQTPTKKMKKEIKESKMEDDDEFEIFGEVREMLTGEIVERLVHKTEGDGEI
ncbi:hypothetical protein QBC46DRAFT_444446 [Diplogelasinospora grovesii]|uniref:Uncharacterized protein n=1 Tax=Diplogelasinospora grovesii TaxID=303347 RepID=A0AAN6NME1_9PEZI|nr:hypothetical protein QBC46DRAFT_444446 [Diplogelasinospora grovesii]